MVAVMVEFKYGNVEISMNAIDCWTLLVCVRFRPGRSASAMNVSCIGVTD